MAKYIYSPANNVFYPYANEDAYRAAGVWPEIGVDFDEDGFIQWKSENAPAGKIRVAGSDGMPAWGNAPELSREDQQASNEMKKSSILSYSTNQIVVFQTKLLMGRKLSDAESAQLNKWMDYIDAINAIDTSSDVIEWPAEPGV
ncbi:tail fiber assembly protein [Salmonella enterica subsp. enterica serovar Agona]|nr:tail fiber assembly protein [Salmonella enterica subsp. enterica serovar Agona]